MPKVKVRVAGTPKPEEKKTQREIIFRGKREPDGKWIYGDLIHGNDGKIYIDKYGLQMMLPWQVRTETIGQYTGLHDKNGERIFEGDIVRIKGSPDYPDYANVDYPALIAFIDGGFCALDGTIEDHGFRRYALARFDFDLEIIGSIHDNPELLEDDND